MKRGEIWLLNFDPTIGAEINKTRPALIVSDDVIGILPLKIVAPITDWKERYNRFRWMVHLEVSSQNNLSKTSAVDAFQLRSVSHERFIRKIGELSIAQMQKVSDALALTLSIQ